MKRPYSLVATAISRSLASGGEQVADAHVLGEQRAEASGIAADVGAAEIAARGIGDHVRAPGRVGDEADAVPGLFRRDEAPALDVRLRPPRSTRPPRGSSERRRRRRCAAPSAAFAICSASAGSSRRSPCAPDDRVRLLAARVVEHDVDACLGDPFAETACGVGTSWIPSSILALVADQELLLERMLGVMARIDLVSREVQQVEAGRRRVDVQDDAAAQVPLVIVERPPRLVVTRPRPSSPSPAGSSTRAAVRDAEQRQQVVEHRDGLVAGAEVALAPGLAALEQRSVAGQQLVEPRVHLLVDGDVSALRAARRNSLRPRRCRRSSRRRARAHRWRSPRTWSREPAVFEPGEQRAAPRRRAAAGVDRLLGVDLLLQLRRAVVRVDEAVDVLAEPQSEQKVVLGRRSCARTTPPVPGLHRRTSLRHRTGPPRRRSSCRSVTVRRAPLMPSGWPIAIAPPFTFTFSSSSPSSRTTASDCDANASFSSTRSRSSTATPRALEQLAHGRHRPDPHHARVDARDGRADERAERLEPELARLLLGGDDDRGGTVVQARRVAGGHGAVRAETPASAPRASRARCRAADARRASSVADGHELVVEAPGLRRGRPALLRAQRERVLVGSRDTTSARRRSRPSRPSSRAGSALPAAGSGSASRASCRRGRGRRAETPSSGFAVTSGARDIDSTPPATKRSPSPGDHRVARADDRGEPGGAQPVHRDAADRLRQPREQHGHARDVAVVLARLVRTAEPHVLDLVRREPRRGRRPPRIASAARSSGRTPASPPP